METYRRHGFKQKISVCKIVQSVPLRYPINTLSPFPPPPPPRAESPPLKKETPRSLDLNRITCARIFKQPMGPRPASPHRLAVLILRNRFSGSLKKFKKAPTPLPLTARVLSNLVEEQYSNTQPFLNPLPMSRASPPSLNYQSTSS
jgi:hypothetical protein